MRARAALVFAVVATFSCRSSPPDLPACSDDFFTETVRQQRADKIDLLFDVDNSPSMSDKFAPIADLIRRLVRPHCVRTDDPTQIIDGVDADSMGKCASGTPEFPPMTNMHIGIVTSSLGPRLGDVCDPNARTPSGLPRHNDDRGHLVNRAGASETPEADMMPSSFLAWFPDVPANAGWPPGAGATPQKDAVTFEKDFADLVAGVHDRGCGIESQLESWYRFLVQPDPYDHLEVVDGRAQWVGVDATILSQRRDFLRPDSLVAVIVVSDENDSEIDVRALGGQAYKWMSSAFQPPRGTAACATNPGDAACTSCAFAPNDPGCAAPYYSAPNDWGFDMNLRHVHMKQKYGVDLQFPLNRYVNGLSSTMVPNRDGEYPSGAVAYVGLNRCTNPLFADGLPDGTNLDAATLCDLPKGYRSRDMVFFAHVGGVPHELLHFDPTCTACSTLNDEDWTKILGKDPERYDYTGIDPHMIESFEPRPGLAPPSSADTADPMHGREWVTNAHGKVDLQFACTFPLATPRDCADQANAEICDCPSVPGATHEELPPLCDPTDVTRQIRGKAYPTVRQIQLVRALGPQGILASICPIDLVDRTGSDPLYGYRPVVAAIVDRLKDDVDDGCFPRALPRDATGRVECGVLEILPNRAPCASLPGRADAPADAADRIAKEYGIDLLRQNVCVLRQLGPSDFVDGSCATSLTAGWCYVDGAAAGTCPQAILFSPASTLNGAAYQLSCSLLTGPECGR